MTWNPRTGKVIAGFCLYCLKSPAEVGPLSREHIVPVGLGGWCTKKGHLLTIHEASCKDCAEITRDFEGAVIEKVFGIARAKAGVKQSHGGKHKPFHWIKTTKNGITMPTLFTVAGYPIHAIVPVFETPPVPLTKPKPEGKYRKVIYNHLLISKPEMDRIGAMTWVYNGEGQHDLVRMLYKVAHCYSYWKEWRDRTFVPYLAPFIRERRLPDDDPLWHLIGSSQKKLVHEPPGLHFVEHSLDEVDGRLLVRVQMRLFANHNGSHTVEVISGHLEPKHP